MTDAADFELLKQSLKNAFQFPDFELTALAGDASDRRFFRLKFAGPEAGLLGAESAVAMVHAPETDMENLPYLNVQAFLAGKGLSVPKVYGVHRQTGVALLEDAGDVSFEEAVSKAEGEGRLALYRKAIDLMMAMQRLGPIEGESACIAFGLAFDEEKLMWELDFFIEHVLGSWKKANISDAGRRALRGGLAAICKELSAMPRFFTHRDYHSRNLMVAADGELAMVDFQDARMGPHYYDLVSLLRDSYSPLSDAEFQALKAYDFERLDAVGLGGTLKKDFQRGFDLMCAQRSLKACGSFAFLDCVKGKNRYLKYFPTAYEYAADALKRLDEGGAILEILSIHIGEGV